MTKELEHILLIVCECGTNNPHCPKCKGLGCSNTKVNLKDLKLEYQVEALADRVKFLAAVAEYHRLDLDRYRLVETKKEANA